MWVRARPVNSSSFIRPHRTGYDAAMKSRGLKTRYLLIALLGGLATTLVLVLADVLQGNGYISGWVAFALSGVAVTAISVTLAWLLTKRIERPITELIRTAERIGE